MSNDTIFGLQFGISLLVYSLVTAWFISPWLRARPARQAAIIVLIPQLVHHIGATTMVSSVVSPDMPSGFNVPVTIGDAIIMVLTLAAIYALKNKSAIAVPILWLFTIVGFVYHPYIGYLGKALQVSDRLGPHWYVGCFYIPVIIISHVLIFMILLRRKAELV
jgi:hypothetical protein